MKLRKKRIKLLLMIVVSILIMVFSTYGAYALVPRDHVVMVSAKVVEQPATIKLSWSAPPTAVQNYNIYRKSLNSSSWGSPIATLAGTALGYDDFGVSVGTMYEYKIQSDNGNGYICSGIKVPQTDYRGKIILVFDDTYLNQLDFKVARLVTDLIGDGWTVIRHDVKRSDTPQNVKALIQADYYADPTNVKSVFLLGHIPICKSGNMAPDGHESRPFPADGYYGDMDGIWNDSNGDGIFDTNILPSDVELQVGRVDLFNLPAFAPLTETDLLSRYLDKDHNYRMGNLNLEKIAFIQDDFQEFGGEAFGRNGYGNFPQLCNGAASVSNGIWKTDLLNNEYLFSHLSGSGTYTSISGTALTTADLAANSYKTNFANMFGSYFGEWDYSDNILRAFLAMKDYGLTNSWGGRPNWFFHHMGMGEAVGYSAKLTQNNVDLYADTGYSQHYVHVALMGDPALRLYPVKPPEYVNAIKNTKGDVVLSWNETATVLGYNIYRADSMNGSFHKINSTIITDTTFTDTTAVNSAYIYMVRSVVLQTSASGTYYDQSTGVIQTLSSETIFASVNNSTGEVTITGKTAIGAGKYVTLRVLDPTGKIDFIDQIATDNSGNYSRVYKYATKMNGVYSLYQGGEGIVNPISYSFSLNLPDIVVESVSFTDSTNKLYDNLPQSGYLQANAVVRNYTSNGKSSTILIILYNKLNKMKQIKISEELVPANIPYTMAVGFDVQNKEAGDYVKVFVWDGVQTMRCLSDIFVLNE